LLAAHPQRDPFLLEAGAVGGQLPLGLLQLLHPGFVLAQALAEEADVLVQVGLGNAGTCRRPLPPQPAAQPQGQLHEPPPRSLQLPLAATHHRPRRVVRQVDAEVERAHLEHVAVAQDALADRLAVEARAGPAAAVAQPPALRSAEHHAVGVGDVRPHHADVAAAALADHDQVALQRPDLPRRVAVGHDQGRLLGIHHLFGVQAHGILPPGWRSWVGVGTARTQGEADRGARPRGRDAQG
jgi:hypothetical protein